MATKYDDDYDDDSDDDDGEDVDIHGFVRDGTREQVEWALSRDRYKLLNYKEKQHSRTPLHTAVLAKRTDMIKLLVKYGAEIDFRDADSCTPLHLACGLGLEEVARFLLEQGASIKAKDKEDLKLEGLARTSSHVPTSQTLPARTDCRLR
jgi:ankyrin repeat protein